MDERYRRLARILTEHSCRVAPGEGVLIDVGGADLRIVDALIDAVTAAGGLPQVWIKDARITRRRILRSDVAAFRQWGELEAFWMSRMQAYIGVRGGNNSNELSDVPAEQMRLYREHVLEPVHTRIRVPSTKWVVLRWPTEGMAQAAGMSTEAFEDFYFDVCTMDYGRMRRACEPLVARMQNTDRVRIIGPGDTDLSFSIKNIPVVACWGERNIPDGECFTAPVRDSVEGVIHFNTPSIYEGVSYKNVRLEFRAGRVVHATADQNADRLSEVLDADDGARYVGEFSLGFNPWILQPMGDILFDEKIAGSLHLTPGQAYEIADNGNRSRIHWDLVLVQRAEFGGGDIWFDDQLIRRNGLFVVEDLKGLNPDALRAPE